MKKPIGVDPVRFLNTPRGHYILAQALAYGIQHIESQPPERREESNLQDMRLLLTEVWPHYAQAFGIQADDTDGRRCRRGTQR